MRFFEDEQGSKAKDLCLLLAVFGALFFQFLGRLPLIDPDEGRYIEIPREMLERGDFVTPMLNYVKYFEKPPLHYWLNAISLSIFGENEFAARFAGTLCGVLTVLVTYYLGRTLFGRRTALLSATLLGTSMGFLIQSRINFTDMTLTCCLTAAYGCFMMAARDEAEHKVRDYYLFYAFMALAVLAKGLIGIVLPGAVIFLYLAVTKRWRLLKEMRICSGTLLFLLICAPWFVLVSLKNPEFPQFFFIHEHFQRFLTKIHHRYQPIWFFVPILLATMLPWSLFIPAALKKGWQDRKRHQETLFLILWAGVIFAFFSKSNSKLVPYILPVFPPLALLIGRWFAEEGTSKSVKWAGTATASLFLLIGGAALAYPRLFQNAEISAADGALLGGLFLGLGVVAFAVSLKGEAMRLFVFLAASAVLVVVIAPPLVYRQVAVEKSAKELARIINERAGADAKIVCFGDYEQGIPFYTHRRVILAGDLDELEFGSKQGDHSAWFVDQFGFSKVWDSPGTVFAILKKRDLPTLALITVTPPEIVATVGGRLIVTNHPLQTAKQLR
jgi:4-amino-4-deoxy-L-arabinose transferase-like glycosyltransferase